MSGLEAKKEGGQGLGTRGRVCFEKRMEDKHPMGSGFLFVWGMKLEFQEIFERFQNHTFCALDFLNMI